MRAERRRLSRQPHRCFLPVVELLEDRLAPATDAISGTVLTLSGFTASTTITASQSGTNPITVVLSAGTWSGTDGSGVTGNGTATLSIASTFTGAIQINDSSAGSLSLIFNGGAFTNQITVNFTGASDTIKFATATSTFSNANGLSLTASQITQTAGLSVTNTLTTVTTAGTTLTNASNNFAKLAITPGGNFSITNSGTLTVLSITDNGTATTQSLVSTGLTYSGGDSALNTTLTTVSQTGLNFSYQNTAGGIAVTTISVGTGDVTLNAAGAISETGATPSITGGSLTTTSGGGTTLGSSVNVPVFNVKGINEPGNVSLSNTGKLVVEDNISAGGKISITAGQIASVTSGAVVTSNGSGSGGGIFMRGTSVIIGFNPSSFCSLNAPGADIQLTGTTGSVSVSGHSTVTAGGKISISAAKSASVTSTAALQSNGTGTSGGITVQGTKIVIKDSQVLAPNGGLSLTATTATGVSVGTSASGKTALLAGSGTITGNLTVNSGGFLLPGNFNPTTTTNCKLTVTGTVAFNSGSELLIVANGNSSGQFSFLNVTGALSVTGSPTVGVSQNYTPSGSTNLTIISAASVPPSPFAPLNLANQHNGPNQGFNFMSTVGTTATTVFLTDPLFPEESSSGALAPAQAPPPDSLPVVPNDFHDEVRGLAQALLAAAGVVLKPWPANTAGPPGLPVDAGGVAAQDLAARAGQAALTRSERGAVIGGLGGADGDQAPDGLDALPAPLAADADQRPPPDE
jgi:hypothetical protein